MDIGSILLALALLVIVAAIIARPMIERSNEDNSTAPAEADELLIQRENVLTSLRDLDFDHTTGKIAEQDYQAQRAALVAQGVAILKQLDGLGVNGRTQEEVGRKKEEGIEAEIEAMIAARRKSARVDDPAGVTCPSCGVSARAGDRFCPNCGAPLASACPTCGSAVVVGDKFCGKCGAKLGEKVGAG